MKAIGTAIFLAAMSGYASAQETWISDPSEIKIHGGIFDISKLRPRELPTVCPRIDVLAISKDISAINVNGYTIGHANGLRFPNESGFAPIRKGGITFQTKNSVTDPAIDCVQDGVEIRLDGIHGQLEVQGLPLAQFDKFVWTKQNLNSIVSRGILHNKPAGISIYEKDYGTVGVVSSGPSRPQPSDGGGGGTGGPRTGSPVDNPFNPPPGPKCCRGGAERVGAMGVSNN